MKRKMMAAVLAATVTGVMLSACSSATGKTNDPAASSQEAAAGEAAALPPNGSQTPGEQTAPSGDPSSADDKAAADNVAALIDAIYVQQRTDKTDEQCLAAKQAWDALTEAQKALVEGENADPDYFGLDTGDASKDDPLNGDDIGENEILAVSFGTSFNDSRTQDIGGIEKAIAAANPDWSVRRAFTAQIIINHIQARDGVAIDNMDQALERAVKNGVKNLVIAPTHLMQGAEYDELMEALSAYGSKFETVRVALPLLGAHEQDDKATNRDKEQVARAVVDAAAADAGFKDAGQAADKATAFVLMGHGTSHRAKVTYTQMQAQMEALGYKNVFIGTVEGEPEETSCEAIIKAAGDAGYKNIILRPLMVVAGDHANNDMAGDDEDSWKSLFTASGAFDSVDAQISGLGSIENIQQVYVDHIKEAFDSEPLSFDAAQTAADVPEDGTYTAAFNTDSGMFKVNEAHDGKGTLTVKDGKMTLHVSLSSTGILNLFPGSAADAAKEGAELLSPTQDQVEYPDGTTETVHGFDIPVPALDTEFDLALIGKKGKWYDHKVSVNLGGRS